MAQYFKKVDGLRFVAIAFVIIQHFAYFIGKHFSAGYYGVDLFFVLSGFLITNILLDTRGATIYEGYKNFMGRRVLRIFPVYYLTLGVLFALNSPPVHEKFTALATYRYNYVMARDHLKPTCVSHFWSLCVEEQFYILWPVIVLLLRNRLRILTMLTVCIVVTGFAQNLFNIFPQISMYNDVSLLTRGSSLGLGGLCAILPAWGKLPEAPFKNKAIEIAVLALLAATLSVPLQYKYKMIVFGFASCFLVLKAAYFGFRIIQIERFLSNDRVIKIATIAYGIYVFHMPIGQYVDVWFYPRWKRLNFEQLGIFHLLRYNSWLIKFPVKVAITIAVARISFRYIESPILKLKDIYFRKKDQQPLVGEK